MKQTWLVTFFDSNEWLKFRASSILLVWQALKECGAAMGDIKSIVAQHINDKENIIELE